MKVSVCIPCWEEERTIYHSILSVINLADEILIWDDGSKDHSVQEIEKIKAQFPDKCIKYSKDVRVGVNPIVRNNLIAHATGDIIITMDGDCCFIEELGNQFLRELQELRPGELRRFKGIEIGYDLNKTTQKVFGPPDVYLTAFLKDNRIGFYANDVGFAKVYAQIETFSRNFYAYHFKFNKAQARIKKRCVYREAITKNREIEKLFKEKYPNFTEKKIADLTEVPLMPELKFKIHKKVVDYVDRLGYLQKQETSDKN